MIITLQGWDSQLLPKGSAIVPIPPHSSSKDMYRKKGKTVSSVSSERRFKTASFLSVSISWMIFRRHSSTPPWIILANVCDILIIKYKCYCKQAMKQMVSWILQYSHIFQLKFTVHQPASFKSCLHCISPIHLNHSNPFNAESAALGVETEHKLSSSKQTYPMFPRRKQTRAQLYTSQKHGR